MSEDNWKKMRELVTTTIKEQLASLKQTQPKPTSGSGEHEHTHFKAGDDICPDCYPNVRKAVIDREFKNAELECDTCHLPVKREDAEKDEWECVNCGGKYAREKE